MSHPTVRILYVLNSADIYGASRSLLRVCEALDRDRFEPMALVPQTGPLIPMLEKAGVKVIHSPVSVVTRRVFKSWRLLPFLFNIPLTAWQLRRIVRKHGINVVHTNVGTILSTGLGARLAGVPHVWHIRDWYGEFGGLWKWYRRYILSCSDVVVCVSHPIAAQFSSAPNVVVEHDGFPLEVPELVVGSASRNESWGTDDGGRHGSVCAVRFRRPTGSRFEPCHAKRKGRRGLRERLRNHLATAIGPAHPWHDGFQTPMADEAPNAIAYGQHATATCCRRCLEYWHGIPQGQPLADGELDYLTELVCLYIEDRVPGLTDDGEHIPSIRGES